MPELEVAYQKFLSRVYEETENPEWNILNHPAQKILENYPHEFRTWVGTLETMYLLKKAGYPFEKNDLSIFEWKAMAFMDNFRLNKSQPY
ncbi:MAG: hypothetical protein VW455_02295 [Nitrospinota bacterium]